MFPEQIKNYSIFRTQGILRTLSTYPVKLWHIKIPDTCSLGILRTWNIFRITWISRIQFTQNFLWPCHLRTRGIFRTLSNIYNEAFCSELCVTLAYLKPWHVQNLRNIWNPVKHLWCSIFLRTLCNPGIFRTLVYANPEK